MSRWVVIAVSVAGLAGAWGCLPTSEPGLSSRDPAMRLNSLLEAAATGDKSAVPGLISRLDSQDGGERLLAINALWRITGETNGYDHAGPPAERDAAIRRWREWSEGGGQASRDGKDKVDHK